MAEPRATAPGAARFPLVIGGARARELPFEPIRAVFAEEGAKVATGLTMPAPGHTGAAKAGRVLWSGRGQALLVGARPLKSVRAAEQSDAWCRVTLGGDRARAVLARLVPLDLSEPAFPEGAVARTLIGHMTALIARTGEGFEIWVFRSMAGTLAHDLERAMRAVAARDAAL